MQDTIIRTASDVAKMTDTVYYALDSVFHDQIVEIKKHFKYESEDQFVYALLAEGIHEFYTNAMMEDDYFADR